MKTKKMSIRISESDLERIHRKARQAGLSLTEYVTCSCLGNQIVVIDGLEKCIRQQKAIGTNLNQLTMLANMGKIQIVYLRELTEEYRKTSQLLWDILHRRRWSDGDS